MVHAACRHDGPGLLARWPGDLYVASPLFASHHLQCRPRNELQDLAVLIQRSCCRLSYRPSQCVRGRATAREVVCPAVS
eukprot:3089720-Pyramimonas_sp.AAC.1